jgi:hypothetical protein
LLWLNFLFFCQKGIQFSFFVFVFLSLDEITNPPVEESQIQHKDDVQNVEHNILSVPRRRHLREDSASHLYYEINSQTKPFLPTHVNLLKILLLLFFFCM